MGVKKISRVQLLEVAGQLMRSKGYAGTSMQQIGQSLGIDKASLYHYFSGKKALTLAVMEAELRHVNEKVLSIVSNVQVPPTQRATHFIQAAEEFLLSRKDGCLMANLAAEVADQDPDFAQLIRRYFDAWVQAISKLKASHIDPDPVSVHNWACDFVAQLHGHLMLYTLFKNASPLQRKIRELECMSGI